MTTASSASPLAAWLASLHDELASLRDRDLLRTLSSLEAVDGARIKIKGAWGVCFSNNDYLGLSAHPRLVRAAASAAARWGVGARASRLLAGSTALHTQLERRLADHFGADDAIVYSSGYLANLGTLQALLGSQDAVVVDRLAHASLIDACRATRATLRVFRHNDAEHAAHVLTRLGAARRRLVVTEGLFSMDGDAAPLADLVDAADSQGAVVYVDDAHGAFALGEQGRGSPEAAGVDPARLIYLGTLGKSLGTQGGFVVGPSALVATIRNRARTFIYSTALAVPVVAASIAALQLITREAGPRRALARNSRWLAEQLTAAGIAHRGASHIVPVILGSSASARRAASTLWERGCFAPAIRPPTVPRGTARLRISLTALHTEKHLRHLVDALKDIKAAA